MKTLLPIVLALTLLAPAVQAADLKADLAFTLGDDNVLRGPGETRKNSPSAFFGNMSGTPLDRAFPTEISESLMLLGLKGAITSGEHFVPEGGLLMKLNLAQGTLKDYGTYLRLNYLLDPNAKDKKVYLELYPNESNALRLGYAPDLAWGVADVFPKNFRKGPVPGLKLGYASKKAYGFVGLKTALVRSPAEDILYNPGGNTNKYVEQTCYGGLAGAGVELFDQLWVEASGGVFQKGNNTRANVLGKPIIAGGGSARLAWLKGLSIGDEIGVRSYFADPLRATVFTDEDYNKGWSFYAAAEGAMLVQTLEDPDRIHSTKNELSKGFGVTLRAKYKMLRLHLLGSMRDLTFILFNVPGLVPYQGLPENVTVTPEIFGALSADLHFPTLGLTPSLTAGVIVPATYKGNVPEGQAADSTSTGVRTMVIMDTNAANWSILPSGEDAMPVFLGRFALKWSYETFAVIGEVFYERDNNLAQVFQDERGHSIRTFDKPDILGFALVARMAF